MHTILVQDSHSCRIVPCLVLLLLFHLGVHVVHASEDGRSSQSWALLAYDPPQSDSGEALSHGENNLFRHAFSHLDDGLLHFDRKVIPAALTIFRNALVQVHACKDVPNILTFIYISKLNKNCIYGSQYSSDSHFLFQTSPTIYQLSKLFEPSDSANSHDNLDDEKISSRKMNTQKNTAISLLQVSSTKILEPPSSATASNVIERNSGTSKKTTISQLLKQLRVLQISLRHEVQGYALCRQTMEKISELMSLGLIEDLQAEDCLARCQQFLEAISSKSRENNLLEEAFILPDMLQSLVKEQGQIIAELLEVSGKLENIRLDFAFSSTSPGACRDCKTMEDFAKCSFLIISTLETCSIPPSIDDKMKKKLLERLCYSISTTRSDLVGSARNTSLHPIIDLQDSNFLLKPFELKFSELQLSITEFCNFLLGICPPDAGPMYDDEAMSNSSDYLFTDWKPLLQNLRALGKAIDSFMPKFVACASMGDSSIYRKAELLSELDNENSALLSLLLVLRDIDNFFLQKKRSGAEGSEHGRKSESHKFSPSQYSKFKLDQSSSIRFSRSRGDGECSASAKGTHESSNLSYAFEARRVENLHDGNTLLCSENGQTNYDQWVPIPSSSQDSIDLKRSNPRIIPLPRAKAPATAASADMFSDELFFACLSLINQCIFIRFNDESLLHRTPAADGEFRKFSEFQTTSRFSQSVKNCLESLHKLMLK